MTISERIVSKKRHTVGYVINREEYTRAQAIKLVKKGEVTGARVAKGPQGPYLVSDTASSLYSLPTRISAKSRRAKTAAKTRKSTR